MAWCDFVVPEQPRAQPSQLDCHHSDLHPRPRRLPEPIDTGIERLGIKDASKGAAPRAYRGQTRAGRVEPPADKILGLRSARDRPGIQRPNGNPNDDVRVDDAGERPPGSRLIGAEHTAGGQDQSSFRAQSVPFQYPIWDNVVCQPQTPATLMSRTKILLVLLLLFVVAGAIWIHRRSTAPVGVPFTRVQRETLVSTLTTNGKVEPSDWVAVRAERSAAVVRVNVQKGQQVPKGALLVELDARDANAEVASAEAAVSQTKAQLQVVLRGGIVSAQVEIANALERNRQELKVAQRDYASLKRLVEKQAATQQELVEAAERVQTLQTAIAALERKRGALIDPADRSAAEARLGEAEASLNQARTHVARSHIHSPMEGIVYELPVRNGVYLNVGDLAANVGRLRTLRVHIYVDEPELGRVASGLPVSVTWDALPSRTWKGTVEKLPTQVVTLGTRQVGDVICTIENEDLKLLPGTNVNVEITSQVVENGLTIPKEAVRTQNGQTGVYVLKDDRVEWRPVGLGVASVTRAVVTSGVAAGDMVALRTEQPLRNGQAVRAAAE